MRVVVDTADPRVVADALRAYGELVEDAQGSSTASPIYRWDEGGRCWVPAALMAKD